MKIIIKKEFHIIRKKEASTAENRLLSLIGKEGIEIKPFDNEVNLSYDDFIKLSTNSSQKIHLSGLVSQIPNLISASSLASAYSVKLPPGKNAGDLMAYATGGVGSPIMGKTGIDDHASFHLMSTQSALMGAFTVMSIVSSQYFLAQINNELKLINLKIDKILEFLYGDKKAELLAEINFAKFAYNNYSSIMNIEAQKIATIQSLQEAKKIAIKDIEFYLHDLNSTVNSDSKNSTSLLKDSQKAFQIHDCLDLSLQLYIISSISELSYSQNYDFSFLDYMEKDINYLIDKCYTNIWGSLSILNRRISDSKPKATEKTAISSYTKKYNELADIYNTGEENKLKKSVHAVFETIKKPKEYYITSSGDLYIKKETLHK